MRLLLNVMRREVPSRHSSGVSPVKRGPDADRFSSVAQVSEQWSTMTSCAPMVEIASKSWPLSLAQPASPGPHADVLHDHVVRGDVDAAADQRDAGRRRGLARRWSGTAR